MDHVLDQGRLDAASSARLPETPESLAGSFLAVRRLGAHRLATRWLGLSKLDAAPRMAYFIEERSCRFGRAEVLHQLLKLSRLNHRHVLSPQNVESADDGGVWVFTAHVGSYDGPVTLAKLGADRGPIDVEPAELRTAAEQLLDALGFMHGAGVSCSEVRMDEVLVDRHGAILLELPGLESALRAGEVLDAEAVRRQTRDVIAVLYEFATGVSGHEPLVPASTLGGRRLRRWDAWFEAGLAVEPAFASSKAALAALPR